MAVKNNYPYFVLAGCMLAAPVPAMAQKAKPAAAPSPAPAPAAPAWELICPPAPAASADAPAAPAPGCGLIQNLVAGEKKQRLLTVIVKRTAPSGYNMTIALPHGLLFAAGVGLQIDEAPERSLAVQTSDANGAYAGSAIDADFLKALKAGKTLKIGFTGGTGQRIIVPLKLHDFAAGVTALDKTPLPPAPAKAG